MIENQKRCIIMRGIVGSGKSTMAEWLAEMFVHAELGKFGSEYHQWREDHVQYYGRLEKYIDYLNEQPIVKEALPQKLVAIHSTDQYFVDNEGNYNWTQSRVVANHSKNYEAFRNSIDAGIGLVLVDNTNTTSKEFTKYQNYAEKNGYWVSFMVMPHPPIDDAVQRNQHNVPGDVIRKMRDRFE